MKEAVLQRIINYVEFCSISKKRFSETIGMEQTTVNNQLLGKRSISIDLIIAILCAYPNVSAEWLLRGNGDMLLPEGQEKDDDMIASERKTYLSVIDRQQKTIDSLNNVIEDYRRELDKVRKAEATEGKGAA